MLHLWDARWKRIQRCSMIADVMIRSESVSCDHLFIDFRVIAARFLMNHRSWLNHDSVLTISAGTLKCYPTTLHRSLCRVSVDSVSRVTVDETLPVCCVYVCDNVRVCNFQPAWTVLGRHLRLAADPVLLAVPALKRSVCPSVISQHVLTVSSSKN